MKSLISLPRWIVWKYETRKGKKSKIPYRADSKGYASSTDPATWTDYASAAAVASQYDGIGFVLGDGFSGIDLDNCLSEDGTPERWSDPILAQFQGTYAEISPSGRGVKIFVKGDKPAGYRSVVNGFPNGGRIEVYGAGRYFTVTGRAVRGHAGDVATVDIEPLCREYLAEPVRTPPPRREASASGDAFARCRAYVAKMPGAISGAGGHNLTLHVACECRRFGLSKSEARQILDEYNLRCEPPWSDREIEHKILSAWAKVAEVGSRLHEDRRGTPPPRASGAAPPDGSYRLGERDVTTGRLVLSPKQTLPTARAFLREFYDHADGRTLINYAGVWMRWHRNRYVVESDAMLRKRLLPWLDDAVRVVTKDGETTLVPFDSNPTTVEASIKTLQAWAAISEELRPPVWIGDDVDPRDTGERRDLLFYPSGTLNLQTGEIMPPTPAMFNSFAIEFDHNPNAPEPTRWLHFLNQLWPNDPESIELLQEWFGYCLVADNRQNKMLLLVGPKRSGKGTIGRILYQLVGKGNAVWPTTGSLAGEFGLQPLIGKGLAIISDARFHGDNITTVVERLLTISGDDESTINRKFLGSVTMRLGTRFLILSNELPRMTDASGALAGRFLIATLKQSFFGQEDHNLERDLLTEIPGILCWACEGLARLRVRGRLRQPESAMAEVRALDDLSSPVGAFLRECCILGAGQWVLCDDLWAAWKDWCKDQGRDAVGTKATFGRDLAAAAPGVEKRRNHEAGAYYEGIAKKFSTQQST